MNERIKELWAQAGGHYNSGNQHTWPEYTINDPVKFAELIVRECCDMVNKHQQHNNPNDCLLVLDIKEHFGVEE
jgi:hypothetical protein